MGQVEVEAGVGRKIWLQKHWDRPFNCLRWHLFDNQPHRWGLRRMKSTIRTFEIVLVWVRFYTSIFCIDGGPVKAIPGCMRGPCRSCMLPPLLGHGGHCDKLCSAAPIHRNLRPGRVLCYVRWRHKTSSVYKLISCVKARGTTTSFEGCHQCHPPTHIPKITSAVE